MPFPLQNSQATGQMSPAACLGYDLGSSSYTPHFKKKISRSNVGAQAWMHRQGSDQGMLRTKRIPKAS
jgi:hypothetical protein